MFISILLPIQLLNHKFSILPKDQLFFLLSQASLYFGLSALQLLRKHDDLLGQLLYLQFRLHIYALSHQLLNALVCEIQGLLVSSMVLIMSSES